MQSDRLLGITLSVFSAVIFLYSWNWPPEAGMYPRAISVGIICLSALLIVRPGNVDTILPGMLPAALRSHAKVIQLALLTVVFIGSIGFLGFFVVLPLFLLCAQFLLGERSVAVAVGASAVITASIYVIFVVILTIPIPAAFWAM